MQEMWKCYWHSEIGKRRIRKSTVISQLIIQVGNGNENEVKQ